MEIQRLRNLTTSRLHTEIEHVYEDLEYITGMNGLMTHMLPNVMKAVEPWLQKKVTEPKYWNGEFETQHSGEYTLEPMNNDERALMLKRYNELPHPFAD